MQDSLKYQQLPNGKNDVRHLTTATFNESVRKTKSMKLNMRGTELCTGNWIGMETERKEEGNNVNKSGYQTTNLIVIALYLCSLHTDKDVDWITIYVHTPSRDTEIFPRPSFHCQYITGLTGKTEKWFYLYHKKRTAFCELLLTKITNTKNIIRGFDICVTVRRWCNNINSQLDATITNFIHNYNQLIMFRAIVSPILRSTRLCLQLVV